jgi:hypothetical protein
MLRIKSPDVQAYFEVLGLDVDDVSRPTAELGFRYPMDKGLWDKLETTNKQDAWGCWGGDENLSCNDFGSRLQVGQRSDGHQGLRVDFHVIDLERFASIENNSDWTVLQERFCKEQFTVICLGVATTAFQICFWLCIFGF